MEIEILTVATLILFHSVVGKGLIKNIFMSCCFASQLLYKLENVLENPVFVYLALFVFA